MSYTYLVDGNAVAYTLNLDNYADEKEYARAYFNRLRDYAKQYPTIGKMILFFDDKNGTWRDDLFPDYQKDRKAQRENYTEEQKNEAYKRTSYLRYIQTQIDESRFDYIHYPHTETDDLVALYCNNIQEDGEIVVILTTDKDLFQLIRDEGRRKVQVLFLIKRKLIKDAKEGKEILEKKIMLGDPSDSVPSVCPGVGPKYYPDFKIFLKAMKLNDVDPTDKEKAKQISESLGIKYINSFSNFDIEQLKINKQLVDLRTVCKRDEAADFEKTNYLKKMMKTAKLSPYSLYNIKLR